MQPTVPGGTPSKDNQLSDQQVVATVNGAPIFASELLERYGGQLAIAKEKMAPQEFDKLRNTLIRRDLGRSIERKLLGEAMKSSLESEQLQQLDQFMDNMFQQEVTRLKKEFKVNSKLELQQKLERQGTSLARLKDEFAAQRMAMEYMGSKVQTNKRITRQDLLDYYRAHAEDYAVPARAKWQQIRITFAKYGGKNQATKVLNEVVTELQNGADFSEAARRHSDGPKAADGGQWPWTLAGSLADEKIEQTLFDLEVGDVSQVFAGDRDFRIVKVTDRHVSGQVPFEEVQSEIQKTLQQQLQSELTRKLINELLENAIIETIFDEEGQ